MNVTATQQKTLQVVPAKKIDDAIFELRNETERKAYVEYESKRYNENDRNRAQKARNCVYRGSQFEGNTDVLVINSDADIHITVNNMNPEETSNIYIRYINAPDFFKAAQQFNKRVNYNISGLCRNCPEGNMVRFGCKSGSGMHRFFLFSRTRKNINGINQFHRIMNIHVKKITQRMFPGVYQEITSWLKFLGEYVPEFLGGEHGFCSQMIVSNNLGCEAHEDQDLADRCFAIWTVGEGTSEDPQGSFFILPYLTCEYDGSQYNGIAIKLRQGCAIEWNGRHIFHASSAPTNPKDVINGNWFGISER